MDFILTALAAQGVYPTNVNNLSKLLGPWAQRTNDGTPCVYILTAECNWDHLVMLEETGERPGHYRALEGSFLPAGTTFEFRKSVYLDEYAYFIVVDKKDDLAENEPTE